MIKTRKNKIKKIIFFKVNEMAFLLSLASILFLDYLKNNISLEIYIFQLIWFNLYIIHLYYIKITNYSNLRSHLLSLL